MHRTFAIAGLGLALTLTACGGSEEADTADPIIVVDGGAAESAATTDTQPAAEPAEASADATADDTADGSATDNDLDDATDEEIALAFADCLRGEGLDVNDPTVNADGSVSLQSLFGGGPPGGEGGEDAQAAFDACGDLLDGANFGPGAGDFDQTEIQDQLVEFAGCLREQGLDVRDPDISGGLVGAAAGGPEALFGVDLQDPQYEAEVQACNGILAFGPGAANQ